MLSFIGFFVDTNHGPFQIFEPTDRGNNTMHRFTFAVLALAMASSAAAQSPQAQQPTAPPPPKTNPVTAPPPPTGRWQWVAEPPPPPQAPPPTGRYVWVNDQPVAAQPAVYAAQQPVAATYQTVTAGPPTQIQLGGGLISAALQRTGACLVQLGSTRTTLTIQRQRTLVGLPAPQVTYATTYTVQQPVQTVYQPVQVAVPQQPVSAPPPAQPPSESVPPPVGPPHPSAQAPSSQPRRVGLLEGVFGPH